MTDPVSWRPKQRVWKKTLTQPLAKWHRHQGSSNDCGPYSVMITANGLLDQPVVNGDVLARAMEGPPALRGTLWPSRIPGWATFPWGIAAALQRVGLHARWRVGVPLRELYANLNRGRVTIVIVGEPFRFVGRSYAGWSHYKVLYAWDPQEGFAFVDPAAAGGVAYPIQREAEFVKQWTKMGRQIVEAWV